MRHKRSETGFRVIFVRECYRMATSKICLWTLFGSTLITLVVMMWIMHAGLPNKIPVAVVDYDNSSTSRALVRQLDAFPKTDIKYKSLSFKDARLMMERGEVYAVLAIPKDFAKDAMSGDRPKLVYYTNNAFLITGSLLFQDLKTVTTLASASVGLQVGTAKGISKEQLMPVIQPITIESKEFGNPWLNYSVYLNPTMIPCILQMIIFILTVSCFGSEVKAGTGRMLLQKSGGSMGKLIAGKLLPYTIVYMLIAMLFMSVFYYYYKMPLHNGFWPEYLAYVLMILASQGVGLILVGLFKHYRLSLSIASLVGSMSLSLSGVSFAPMLMHPSMEALTKIVPIRYFILIHVDQSLNGIPFTYSLNLYASLIIFIIIGLLFSGRIKGFLSENAYEE